MPPALAESLLHYSGFSERPVTAVYLRFHLVALCGKIEHLGVVGACSPYIGSFIISPLRPFHNRLSLLHSMIIVATFGAESWASVVSANFVGDTTAIVSSTGYNLVNHDYPNWSSYYLQR